MSVGDVSRVTVMDPLGGPGEAKGLRRLRYLAVAVPAPEGVCSDPDGPSPEQLLLDALLHWLGGPNAVLVVPAGTVVVAVDPDTGACLWSTGTVPGAAAEGGAP